MLNHPRFRQLLTGIQSYYLILFFLFPLLYAIFLVVIALPLRPFYDGNIGQIPVQLSVLLWGLLTSFLLPGLAYVILHLDKENLKKAHKNVVAQFVLKQDHTKLFNTSLFQDVNEGKSIERVEALSGGYSGAKVFAFLRPGGNVRSILKIAEIEEIENEYEKFETYIHNDRVTKMSSAPNKGIIYRWGTYGGLEYNFVGSALIDAYQPFADLYRLGIQQMVETSKLVALLHDTIFMELSKTWNWISLDRYRVYVYRHYYPFTRKFDEIRRWLHRLHQTHNPDLPQSNWDDYWNTLFNFIDLASWELRMMMESVNPRMAMVLIHGDLNSRNIIVGTKNSNPNEIHSINFIDFSHTGNGLTRSRTSDFKEYLYKQNGEYLGHVADDFFRLEADIKFSLTNLQDEQAWRQVWILENLMLEQGLQLHSWDDLIAAHAFAHFLQRSGLVNEAAWQELAENTAWESADAYQYKQMWQCVRAIRAALVTVLERPPQSMVPYYIAQLQTGLTMIYWEDERFYNAELQKLYMAMSAALLCKQLSINNQ